MFHQTRSQLMSSIRGKGNKRTELALVKFFRSSGAHGWRRHAALIGKPDFVFVKERLAIFADGCFWHKCPKCFRAPRSNSGFWEMKIDRNCDRDEFVNSALKERGWTVFRFWEHELKGEAFLRSARFKRFLKVLMVKRGQLATSPKASRSA